MKIFPPVVSCRGIMGSYSEWQNNRLKLFEKCLAECPEAGRIRFGPFYLYMVFHPGLIKEVLLKQTDHLLRETSGYKNIRMILGRGLVTSDGDNWRRQRQQANKYFSPQRINQLVPNINEAVVPRIREWDVFIGRGFEFNVHKQMSRLNLGVFDACFLGNMLGQQIEEFHRSQVFLADSLFKRSLNILNKPLWFPTAERAMLLSHIRNVQAILGRMIDNYKKTSSNNYSIISLILSPDMTSNKIDIDLKTAKERLWTFIATGHQTLSTMLTWLLYLFTKYPAVEEQVIHEVRAVLGDRPPTAEDLPKLIYTEQVLKECLRLYPPIWNVPKRSIKNMNIGKYHIPAGSIIMVSQYFTHRHPDFWERPEEFIPERFSPEKAGKIDPYAYFPFGAGPHHCIGQGLAMTQAKIIIAHVIRKYRFRLLNDEIIDVDPRFELLPKKSVIMRVERV